MGRNTSDGDERAVQEEMPADRSKIHVATGFWSAKRWEQIAVGENPRVTMRRESQPRKRRVTQGDLDGEWLSWQSRRCRLFEALSRGVEAVPQAFACGYTPSPLHG